MKFLNTINSMVPTVAKNAAIRAAAKTKHESPNLLFGAGIVGVVGGTVLACRATLKAVPVITDLEEDLGIINGQLERDDYSATDRAKDLTLAYGSHGYQLAKLYAPSVIVMGLSITALTTSHVQMRNRQEALVAAYTGLQVMHEKYRDRVRDELGEDRERDIFQAAVERAMVDDKGEHIMYKVGNPNEFSPYARFFDEASREWTKDPELNRLFVQSQQTYLNQRLQVVGHVFLNEAYDALGLDRSSQGQVVGWVMNGTGDNFIDFGIFEPRNIPFVNGYERAVLLDFNVDGLIIDKI